MTTRPSEHALWASVETTLREVVLGAVADDHAHAAVVHLIGLARYARQRGPDPSDLRATAVVEALDSLATNPIVAAHWPQADAASACSFALVDAIGRDDGAALEVRTVLRTLLLDHLDADLIDTGVLDGPFRGRLPDA